MLSKSPKDRLIPLPNGLSKWRKINGCDPNHTNHLPIPGDDPPCRIAWEAHQDHHPRGPKHTPRLHVHHSDDDEVEHLGPGLLPGTLNIS